MNLIQWQCRQGLGHRLMACAEERARELGADQIWLGVMVKNAQAMAWYKKLGFTAIETSPFVMGSTTVDHFVGYLPLPLPKPGRPSGDEAGVQAEHPLHFRPATSFTLWWWLLLLFIPDA